MAAPSDDKSLALYCDFENIALGVRDAKYQKFDIHHILERLLVKGSIVVKKAYCDWDRYKNFKGPMHEAAFELIEIPHVRMSGKNSADIRMVVDALDLCYTKSHVDTFVIISGDSDFSPLVSKLRENAKTVIGVGVKNSTSDLLISSCDEFIYYDDLVRELEKKRSPARKKRASKKRSARTTRDDGGDESDGRTDGEPDAKVVSIEAAAGAGAEPAGEAPKGRRRAASKKKSAAAAEPAADGTAETDAGDGVAGAGDGQGGGASRSKSASRARRGSRRSKGDAGAAEEEAPAEASSGDTAESAGSAAAVVDIADGAPIDQAANDAPETTEDDDDAPEDLAQEGLDMLLETALALSTERGGADKLWGSMVKQTLKRRRPGFNESYYGYDSFRGMLEEAAARGYLTLEHDDRSGGYIITKIAT